MKKFFIMAAFAVFTVFSCSHATVAEKQAAFEAQLQDFMTGYQEDIKAVTEDTELTDEQKQQKAGEITETAQEKYKAICMDAIKKNRDNSVSVAALQEVYYMLEPDELEKVISSLADSLQTTEFIQTLTKSLSSKKLTAEGQKFTDFTIVQDPENEEASTVKFSDYAGQGKYLLVDFWASWCGPCKAEIPNIANVWKKYAGEDFEVLSIAVWDKPEATRMAALEEGIDWKQIINAQAIPTDIYGIEGIPHIMLIGPDGTILKRNLRGEAIEEEVAKYVKAK